MKKERPGVEVRQSQGVRRWTWEQYGNPSRAMGWQAGSKGGAFPVARGFRVRGSLGGGF